MPQEVATSSAQMLSNCCRSPSVLSSRQTVPWKCLENCPNVRQKSYRSKLMYTSQPATVYLITDSKTQWKRSISMSLRASFQLMSRRVKASSEIPIKYAGCLTAQGKLTIKRSQKTKDAWGERDKEASNVPWSGQVTITCDLCELWLLPTEIEKCRWKRNEDKAMREFRWPKQGRCSEQNGDRRKVLKGRSQSDSNIWGKNEWQKEK